MILGSLGASPPKEETTCPGPIRTISQNFTPISASQSYCLSLSPLHSTAAMQFSMEILGKKRRGCKPPL